MPADIENPYPITTATEVEAAPGDQAVKAARNIMVRYMDGMIPRRGFLLGQNDGSTIMRGVTDLTSLCYKLLFDLDPEPDAPSQLDSRTLALIAEMREMLEDHKCPTEA